MLRYKATVGDNQISCKTYQIDSFDETLTSSESSNIDLTIGGFPIKNKYNTYVYLIQKINTQ